jgi:2-polyprenyl-3-methyl-5-hydroxy-6-metoxy-1,4-benzoquinol methylase
MILIQASSRSWAGGEDFSLRSFDGAPAVLHTLRAARASFPDVPIRVIAPAFDRGGRLDEIVSTVAGDAAVLYGFDDSPLDRMLVATEQLGDGALVLRGDGLHFGADFEAGREMLGRAAAQRLDGMKTPDDFPPALSVDVLRVGALRRARAKLRAGDPFLVHVKFFLAGDPEFRFAHYEDVPVPTDRRLRELRAWASAMLHDVERLDVDSARRVASGDSLTYHYEFAGQYLTPTDRVLDIACGDGFGVRELAPNVAGIVGADLDEPSIVRARELQAADNEKYLVADATALPFGAGAFDAVLSMETFEHVPQRPFLRELGRVVKPGGVLVLSTPQNRLGHIPFTPAHEREFTLEEVTAVVSEQFAIAERIGLKAGTISFPGDPVGTNTVLVARARG